ncbi:hypothetical protein CSUB01_12070 [Colletotrichum sublineola]|uniref:Uncharacterized protein n=1 Tax=Colletotrichum sublineola TaxID=1173701 RepID=A0A066XRY4_COLSU|nr:hypothetical protein CSUB01_12070 [Colletotrichum sublineola]
MDAPQLTPYSRGDNLTVRVVAAITHELTTCISHWHHYAASKEIQIRELSMKNQQYEARIKAQDQTIHAQEERIRRLEFERFSIEMSPMELSDASVSPAAFPISLQSPKAFVVDMQSNPGGEAFADALQETYDRASDDDNASNRDDIFAPLLALTMSSAEDTSGQDTEARESPQTESRNPMKRRMEEADIALKRVRYT